MKLAEQQAKLAKWVLDTKADRVPDGLASLKDLPADQGAALYRDSILEVEIRALIITFPVVHQLVGDKYFRLAALSFLRGGSLQDGNLDRIGEAFPDFLPTVPGYERVPYIADVARLELALGTANDGADPVRLDAKFLEGLAQDAASVRLQVLRNATLLESPFPVDRIHAASLEEVEDTLNISQDDGIIRLIVWRSQSHAEMAHLDQAQWDFLSALRKEPMFVKAYELALKSSPQLDVAVVLGEAVSRGWIEPSA